MFSLPWNQQTIRGWIYETVFSVISSSLYLLTNVVFLTFFVAICEYHQAFLHYLKALLKEIKNVKDKSQVKVLLCDIIHFNISSKRYIVLFASLQCASTQFLKIFRFFWETSDVYSLILLTQMLCIVLHMTCSVFQMDMVTFHWHWTAFRQTIPSQTVYFNHPDH